MAAARERQSYGEYETESLLGHGSIGTVYLARHRRIGRKVALKVIEPEEQRFEDEADRAEFFERLQREAELCGRLQHPNIVSLYDVGYEDDVVSFLATEYVDGESLAARLKRTRPLPVAEAISIAADVLRGLAVAHDHGIVHRDVKPANILITAAGQAKIADFGIARLTGSNLTRRHSLLGTPTYMSPEQVRGIPVTPRSDLFSVGTVLYEMLTGVKPFASSDLGGVLFNIVDGQPQPVSSLNPLVPPALGVYVATLLHKSPSNRFASAAEALDALEKVAAGVPQVEKPPATDPDITTPLALIRDPLPTPRDTTAPPALSEKRSWTKVNGMVAALVLLVLTGAIAAAVVSIEHRITKNAEYTASTAATRESIERRRRDLDEARRLAAQGRYVDALAHYDSFLRSYPDSRTAAAERARIAELAVPATDARLSVTAPGAPRGHHGRRVEPEPPLSRWERFKRLFHHH